MTRRWFLKLVSALAPLFGVKIETEAAPPRFEDAMRGTRRVFDAEPEVNELLARCRVPGTLTAAVLNAGCIIRGGDLPIRDGLLECARMNPDGLTFQVEIIHVPMLNNAKSVEDATLGLTKGIHGVVNHPNATKLEIVKGERLVCHVLKMQDVAIEKKFYGPYAFIYPEKWNWNGEYGSVERVMKVQGISCVVPVEELNETRKIALVQLTPDVIQMVVCHDRIVPRIRSNIFGNCGIVIAEEG